MDWNLLIVWFSAIAAGLSFIGFAWPMLHRVEKKERFESLIQQKRKNLFDAAKQQTPYDKDSKKKDSMASFFKIKKLAGEMGEKIRDKMLQAGYRSHSALLTFLLLKIALPVIFSVLTMVVLTLKPEPLPGALGSLIILGLSVFGFYLPDIMVKNQKLKRQQEIALSFPDALDMILICVQGGIGIEQAIDRIAHEMAEHSETLAEELGILSAELSMLNDRKAAFQGFARRVGSGSARSFATAMMQAEQYGTSISQAMQTLAEDQRDQRMAEAERKAASLPPKLTVPMILFFLPALFIVILGPAAIQAMALN
ncbi:MAG: type II secretion protein F [Micavibrio sp.]|nr:type II secretion protein F [Micavibrio sp.]